jgi:pimeloyl-ACP methyl ester carboxylesterase
VCGVHALFAKPLDWCVIQLARRCVKAERRTIRDSKDTQPFQLEIGFAAESVSPMDFALMADGSFRFASPVKTAAPRNNTVHGRLYTRGGDWMRRPTVVLLHGWNAEWCYRRMFPALARRLESAGINTAAFELPYHMQRRPRNGPVTDFISSDPRGMMEATRQAVADARALCRWLEAQGATALGLWGFSLGAWLAGLVLSVESHLHCAVLTTPIVSMDRAVADLPFCEPVRRGLARTNLELGRFNLWAHAHGLNPRNLLLVESRHDLFAPAESVEQLWRAWGQPDIWRLSHGHISVLLSRSVMERTVQWISGRMATADSD